MFVGFGTKRVIEHETVFGPRAVWTIVKPRGRMVEASLMPTLGPNRTSLTAEGLPL